MESRRRYKWLGGISLLALAVLVGGVGWMMYRQIRQDKLNRALFVAIRANQPETAIRLLEEGADPNARDTGNRAISLHQCWMDLYQRFRGRSLQDDGKLTPLLALYDVQWATRYSIYVPGEDIRLLQTLLDKGANVNATDETGRTALMMAGYYTGIDQVRLLLSHGADVNARNRGGRNALIWATVNDNQAPEIIQVLLVAGAQVNMQDEDGITALQFATVNRGYQETRALLEHGADANARDKLGWPPLFHAIVNNNDARMVRLLLQYGADPNLKGRDGDTPLKMAGGDSQIISLLKQAGAKE